ncbi:MAG: hypothetical protein FD180_1152 [Planctomycetota bacterium]|nr:MAG: hypothetical protein FD180_1152 [Planctomycetota bacterium]
MLDGKAAIPLATRAVAAEPWNASNLDTLAEAYRADGNWKEAAATAGRALDLAPLDRDPMGAPYYERQAARMEGVARLERREREAVAERRGSFCDTEITEVPEKKRRLFCVTSVKSFYVSARRSSWVGRSRPASPTPSFYLHGADAA